MLIKEKWERGGLNNETLAVSVKLGPTALLVAEIARRPSTPLAPAIWWLCKISIHGRIQIRLSTVDIVGRIFEGEGGDCDDSQWCGWELGSPDFWIRYFGELEDAVDAADCFMHSLLSAYEVEVAAAEGYMKVGPGVDGPDPEINGWLKKHHDAWEATQQL